MINIKKGNSFSVPGEDTKRMGFELYFTGHYKGQMEEGKVWFKGDTQHESLCQQRNAGKPIKVIVQIRTEFSYPFFVGFY